MKRALIPLLALAFILTFHPTAIADEGQSHDSHIKKATEKTSPSHTDDHSSVGTHEENHGTADSHTEEDDSGHVGESKGHHGPVVETLPNYKILGAYGAVNLTFIIIGVWNKWFNRKGNK